MNTSMSKWELLKKKLRAIWRVARVDEVLFSSILAPREQLQALIGSELRDKMKPRNAHDDLFVSNLTNSVFTRITLPPRKTFEEKFFQTVDGIASIGLWNFYNVCGIASVWEYEIRLLANRYGVEIKVPLDKKPKKARRKATIVLRYLEDIIKDFNQITSKRLNIGQDRLLEIRNSLVHGNFQELRVKATGGKHRFPDEYRGNVFVGGFEANTNTPRNLSEVTDEHSVEQEDLFGWFLEGTNSKMLHDLHEEFMESVESIRTLMAFKSMSFDDRLPLFNKLVYEGKTFTENDIAVYRAYMEHESSAHKGMNANAFIAQVQRLFKNPRA